MTLNEKRMEKLNRLYVRCRTNMEKIGIEVGNVTKLEILGKTGNVGGYCIKDGDGFVIQISNVYLDDCPDEIGETVVYHELVHTVPGCYGHGDKFHGLLEKIHKEYHTINNLYSRVSPEENGYILKKAKWAYRCGTCGWMQVRTGTKGPRNNSPHQCPRCSHFLKPITGEAFERLKTEMNKKYFEAHPNS